MCSYFTHFADNAEQEAAARARQIRYYKECVIDSFPGDPATAPPSYRYFIEIVQRLHKIKAEDLTENAVLIGSLRAHHRNPEEGRGRGLRRGDPLRQCRPQTAPAGKGRDGALHGRSEPAFHAK